jgi:hypothetical protein
MIADGLPPFSPVFFILPFEDLFNNKFPKLPGSALTLRGITEVNNAKPAPADVAYRVSPFQVFTFADTG